MNIPQKHQAELAGICDALRRAMAEPSLEASRRILSGALRRAEKLSKVIGSVAATLGQKGGQRTAARGSEYFREIAAMRKTRAGGRPKKSTTTLIDPLQ